MLEGVAITAQEVRKYHAYDNEEMISWQQDLRQL
jgi:hypothetical protein